MTAAKFLKKSDLSDVVHSRIWDLSDPNGKGFLDKPGFFVALKLVSLAQSGQVINMTNIYFDTQNPPKVVSTHRVVSELCMLWYLVCISYRNWLFSFLLILAFMYS